MELKEIQNSLPRATQHPDFYSSTRTKQLLKGVPVCLLPLVAECSTASSPSSSGYSSPVSRPSSPAASPLPEWSSISFRAANKRQPAPEAKPPAPPARSTWTPPPHLAHLVPKVVQAPKPKPHFAFVPLCEPSRSDDTDTETETETDPPTPLLTDASLDSDGEDYFESCPRRRPSMPDTPPTIARRNFIIVNGARIDLDDDHSQTPTPKEDTALSIAPSLTRKSIAPNLWF